MPTRPPPPGTDATFDYSADLGWMATAPTTTASAAAAAPTATDDGVATTTRRGRDDGDEPGDDDGSSSSSRIISGVWSPALVRGSALNSPRPPVAAGGLSSAASVKLRQHSRSSPATVVAGLAVQPGPSRQATGAAGMATPRRSPSSASSSSASPPPHRTLSAARRQAPAIPTTTTGGGPSDARRDAAVVDTMPPYRGSGGPTHEPVVPAVVAGGLRSPGPHHHEYNATSSSDDAAVHQQRRQQVTPERYNNNTTTGSKANDDGTGEGYAKPRSPSALLAEFYRPSTRATTRSRDAPWGDAARHQAPSATMRHAPKSETATSAPPTSPPPRHQPSSALAATPAAADDEEENEFDGAVDVPPEDENRPTAVTTGGSSKNTKWTPAAIRAAQDAARRAFDEEAKHRGALPGPRVPVFNTHRAAPHGGGGEKLPGAAGSVDKQVAMTATQAGLDELAIRRRVQQWSTGVSEALNAMAPWSTINQPTR